MGDVLNGARFVLYARMAVREEGPLQEEGKGGSLLLWTHAKDVTLTILFS